MPPQQHVPQQLLVALGAELLHPRVGVLGRRGGGVVHEADDRHARGRVLARVARHEQQVVEPPVVRIVPIIPRPRAVPGVDRRHGERVAGVGELVRPRPHGRLVVPPHRHPRRRLRLEVVVPVAPAVVRIHRVVAHERLGEVREDHARVALARHLAAHRVICLLARREVVEPGDVLAAGHTALRRVPAALPLDGAVDLPVGEDEPHVDALGLVGAAEEVHLLPHRGVAALELERAAELVALGRRGVEEAIPLGVDVRGLGAAVAHVVGAGVGIDVHAQAEPLLCRAHAERLVERLLPVAAWPPGGAGADAACVERREPFLDRRVVARHVHRSPHIERQPLPARELQRLGLAQHQVEPFLLRHAFASSSDGRPGCGQREAAGQDERKPFHCA